jgi:hypothetical protein
MSAYELFECVTGDGAKMRIFALREGEAYVAGGRICVNFDDPDESGGVALSAQDARRMGEALIELAKANGA